ncbi:MAG: hypothetical protein WC477_00590 [Patescibacteria group bacterium]
MTDFLRPSTGADIPAQAEGSLVPPVAPVAPRPTRPFERVPVPRAGIHGEGEKPSEPAGKKGKKPSPMLTHYYLPSFLILICVLSGGGYALLDPLFSQLKMTNEMIVAHNQESADAQAYLDSIERSIVAAQAIPEDVLNKVDAALPRDVDEPRLLATMEAFGKKTGISLDSVQFSTQAGSADTGAPVSTLEVDPISISLNVISPSYTAARIFLQEVEQSIPLLDVSRISVSGDKVTGEFTYQLEMKTYSVVKAKAVVVTPNKAAAQAPAIANAASEE